MVAGVCPPRGGLPEVVIGGFHLSTTLKRPAAKSWTFGPPGFCPRINRSSRW